MGHGDCTQSDRAILNSQAGPLVPLQSGLEACTRSCWCRPCRADSQRPRRPTSRALEPCARAREHCAAGEADASRGRGGRGHRSWEEAMPLPVPERSRGLLEAVELAVGLLFRPGPRKFQQLCMFRVLDPESQSRVLGFPDPGFSASQTGKLEAQSQRRLDCCCPRHPGVRVRVGNRLSNCWVTGPQPRATVARPTGHGLNLKATEGRDLSYPGIPGRQCRGCLLPAGTPRERAQHRDGLSCERWPRRGTEPAARRPAPPPPPSLLDQRGAAQSPAAGRALRRRAGRPAAPPVARSSFRRPGRSAASARAARTPPRRILPRPPRPSGARAPRGVAGRTGARRPPRRAPRFGDGSPPGPGQPEGAGSG